MSISKDKYKKKLASNLELVTIENEKYFKISNNDTMRPFFMSIVSNSNHWMFLSSNGGLTAGRKNSDYSLFPYYTDDKITESADITGSKTIFQIIINDTFYLWEPFSISRTGRYNITRNLYKSIYGNKIVFEEINNDLQLTFMYQWSSSNRFGFVKKSSLKNNSNNSVKITYLDGIQNIIPYGVPTDMQNGYSNLVDAYKRSELKLDTGIGIYALSAIIVDKAAPSEALKANIAWSVSVKNPTYLMSSLQLNSFRKGNAVNQELDIKAEKGAYFVSSKIELASNSEKKWFTIANVNQSISNIIELSELIKNNTNLIKIVNDDIDAGTKNLMELTCNADGLQLTQDALSNTRHFSNTLFNIMRGGIFDNDYTIEKKDFITYISNANKTVFKSKEKIVDFLPNSFSLKELKTLAIKEDDVDFKRLCIEYLPLKFSRRHGDPSRPWNKFSINTHSEIDGSKILDYEGNWRDIFQNWEALAHSYPEFIEGMIYKFLNATTFDGYNPYRVTKSGFDWETIEADDPWSYIGYWGDHQIIYLLKLLEFIQNHYPKKLESLFDENIFVYANVPYKIKPYNEILKNPKDTIDFDLESDSKIRKNRDKIGADGALLSTKTQSIYKVNLIEKLLATVLAKVSNFIPEAGIWMNTQRPEWNDANNALVGNGVSMVTLYYLRRFLKFLDQIIAVSKLDSVKISEELSDFFNEISSSLINNKALLSNKITDKDRKNILDSLGNAGSNYRKAIYNNGFSSNKKSISKDDLLKFINITVSFIDHSIKANKRVDNLYHSYNLMTVKNENEISISYLSEMLEGQVAVLSSGYLSAKESLDVLDALKNSSLYREDQQSYILYPNKELPKFIDKNNIPIIKVGQSDLLNQLVKDKNTQIIEKDVLGNYHFNGNFNNADCLKKALINLEKTYQSLVEKDINLVLEIFEDIFNHKAFTGRSGTFYGYEGLGSIYWHMISKLSLAAQENYLLAIKNKDSNEIINKLKKHYFEINKGIGVHKSPELYGAFPTDPYSHTPIGKGAQQPGMTGQVKEDIITRFGELGVSVNEGSLSFNPCLLRKEEFLNNNSIFKYTSIKNGEREIKLKKDSICFTYCQVLVIYTLSGKPRIKITFSNGDETLLDGLILNREISSEIFSRTGEVEQIVVYIKK